jgi:hypothetical protein
MPDSRIRKSISELSRRDLDRCPIWEFASDEEGEEGQDETTVRPLAVSGDLNPSAGVVIVRARFILADGTEMTGYLTLRVPPDNGLDSLQPVIVTDEGQVLFWWGIIGLKGAELADLYRRLGKAAHSEVFPVRFVSDVPIAGGPVNGDIGGFMVLEDWRTNRVKLLK